MKYIQKKSLACLTGCIMVIASTSLFAITEKSKDLKCDPSTFSMAVKSVNGLSVIKQPLKPGESTTYSIPFVQPKTIDQTSFIILYGKGVTNCTFRKSGGTGDTYISSWRESAEDAVSINIGVMASSNHESELNLIIEPQIGKWGKPEFKQFIITHVKN